MIKLREEIEKRYIDKFRPSEFAPNIIDWAVSEIEARQVEKVCEHTLRDDGDYTTKCNNEYYLNGSFKEFNYVYCPFCSGRIVEK